MAIRTEMISMAMPQPADRQGDKEEKPLIPAGAAGPGEGAKLPLAQGQRQRQGQGQEQRQRQGHPRCWGPPEHPWHAAERGREAAQAMRETGVQLMLPKIRAGSCSAHLARRGWLSRPTRGPD